MRADHPPHSYRTVSDLVESIASFLAGREAQFLFEKTKSLPDDALIVEIGSLYGRSSAALAFACVGTQRRILCIDPWGYHSADRPGFFPLWQHNLARARLSQYAVPIIGLSQDAFNHWNEIAPGKQIDFLFNDASHEFTDCLREFHQAFPLVKEGGFIALHDVCHHWPGSWWVWNHVAKPALTNHESQGVLRCGQKPSPAPLGALHFPNTGATDLPIHFFTTAFNGMAHLPQQLATLQQLPFRWHWHIIEGACDRHFDKSHHVPPEFHNRGKSIDGTTEFARQLAGEDPDRVTLYQLPEGDLWYCKLQMFNAPLDNIHENCLLFQLDCDEFWTPDQLTTIRRLFLDHPEKTSASFPAQTHVGPDLITRPIPGAQEPSHLRAWRYLPGCFWNNQLAPTLVAPQADATLAEVAPIHPFTVEETSVQNLRFHHHTVTTARDAHFKERSRNREGLLSAWLALQAATQFPIQATNLVATFPTPSLIHRIS
jgi:hypothetical protein